MNSDKYEGWTNYETWAVKLWIDNEESLQDFWRERTVEAYASAVEANGITKAQHAAIALAGWLQEEHEDNAPDLPNSIYSDLLNASLQAVNWNEIAGTMVRAYLFDKENTK